MKKANKDSRYSFRADKDFDDKLQKAFEAYKKVHTGQGRVSVSDFIRETVAKKIGVR